MMRKSENCATCSLDKLVESHKRYSILVGGVQIYNVRTGTSFARRGKYSLIERIYRQEE